MYLFFFSMIGNNITFDEMHSSYIIADRVILHTC